MRTVKEPTVRKQEILDGAIRVFAKYGYEKATISTIAKELKISQGLCYRYFPSKEDIYRAAVEKYTDMILEGYRSAWQEEKPIREWIGGIADSFGRLAEAETRDENLYALFHGSNSEQLHKDLMLRGAEKILPHIQEILRKAVYMSQ